MSDIKISIDGNEYEPNNLPEEYGLATPNSIHGNVVRKEVHSSLKDDFSKRLSNATESAVSKALKDAPKNESVQNQAISELGYELDEDRNIVGANVKDVDINERIDKERSKWEENILSPIQERLDETLSENNELTRGYVMKDINDQAGRMNIKEGFLDDSNGPSLVQLKYAPQMEHNKELKKSLFVDSDGNFERHPNGKKANGHGFVEMKDYIQLHPDDPFIKEAQKDKTQGGSDFQNGGTGDSKQITRTEFDSKGAQERKKLMDDGVKVVDE